MRNEPLRLGAEFRCGMIGSVDRKAHWNQVYETKQPNTVTW